MHVVVIGCGRVGSNLATALERMGHSVAILDRNPSAFGRLPEAFGGTTVVGLAMDADHLVAAGIERADAVAAVTSGDNSNIVAARMAREQYGVQRVVARIYDPRRAEVYQRMGIPTVATVSWATDQVLRRLVPDAVASDWSGAAGKLVLVERELPVSAAGVNLATLSRPGQFTIAAVTRNGEGQLVTDSSKGQEGDVLHIMCAVEAIADLESVLQSDGESS